MKSLRNHAEYLQGMENIDSALLEKVEALVENYEYYQVTTDEVEQALGKERLSIEDYAAILSPAAEDYLEEMAAKAKVETRKHFGNSIQLFTPLYVSN